MGRETRDYLVSINKDILQAFGGVKEVKILERENYFTDKFDADYKGYADRQTKYFIYGMLPRPLMETVCISGLLLVIVVKLLNGTQPTYFVTTVSVFAVAAFRMLPSFSKITNNLNNVMFNKASVNALYNDCLLYTSKRDRQETLCIWANICMRQRDSAWEKGQASAGCNDWP